MPARAGVMGSSVVQALASKMTWRCPEGCAAGTCAAKSNASRARVQARGSACCLGKDSAAELLRLRREDLRQQIRFLRVARKVRIGEAAVPVDAQRAYRVAAFDDQFDRRGRFRGRDDGLVRRIG